MNGTNFKKLRITFVMGFFYFFNMIFVYKNTYIKLAALLACLVFNISLNAAESSTQQFTITEGLSNNSVKTIFQDSRGFLWIGTQDGLNRYDGYNFEVFKSGGENGESLAGNCITAIEEDRNGNIWIGTSHNGISILLNNTGTFKHYQAKPDDATALPENMVADFFLTAAGEMWIKLENYLVRYNEVDDTFQSFGHFSNVFKRSENNGSQILEESDTTFLVGTKDGINRFYHKTGLFERLHIYEEPGLVFQDEVTHIQPIARKQFLMASQSGLYLIEPGQKMAPVPATMSYGANVSVSSIAYDSNGNIWLGTNRGLELYEGVSGTHSLYHKKSGDRKPLISKEVSVLYSDASGLLWVGTRYNGLFKINLSPPKFSFLGEESVTELPLRSHNIRSVYEDSSGRLWLGTLTSGAYVLDKSKKLIKHFVFNPERYRNHDDVVESLYEDAQGTMWAGTNSGIYIIEPPLNRVREFHYVYDARYTTLLRNNLITAISGDSIGNMWFGTHFGLYRYANNKIVSYFSTEGSKALAADHITSLCPDDKGGLWIGTVKGLSYYQAEKGKIVSFDELNVYGAIDKQILSLAVDNKDRLWAGTRSGLYSICTYSADSIVVEAVEGLKNAMIPAVVPDSKRRIWVSSSKGVSMYSPEGTVRDYDIHDGVPGQLFNSGSAFRSKDGTLYFGSVSGLCWVHPDSLSFNMYRPRIAITDILLCIKGDCKEVLRGELSELRVKYKPDMMLDFTFAALEFTQAKKNSYKVMVEGYDKEWRPVTKNNTLTISNLMPGKYRLRIMASNNDFTWNNQPLELPIVITPPLWMTKYAYAFYLLLLIFIIQMMINFRVRHYKRANRTLEEKSVDKQHIEEQREVLSRINQNLTDSINYATRIQAAMIPTEKVLRTVISDAFVYFRPKDLVSGDFYWMHQRDDKIFIAVVDCTGHGVPGAFMSIIGIDLLRNIVAGQKIDNPALILEELSSELDQTLRKNDHNLLDPESIRDGMDMAICVLNTKEMTMQFAGAVNGIYLVSDNKLENYKGDRVVIGRTIDGKVPEYSCKDVPISRGDMVYMFTDGYVDQFGGSDHKKFKHLRFRHLLLNIHELSTEDQKSVLHQKFEEWRGEGEQTDDILVLGFRI